MITKVLYLCDQKRSKCKCTPDYYCCHTEDLAHAKNWDRVPTNEELKSLFRFVPVETEILPDGITEIHGIYVET